MNTKKRYTLEMVAGAVAHPKPEDRELCKRQMWDVLSELSNDLTVNDPLPNGALNIHGKVTKPMTIEKALEWTIDFPFEYHAVSSISFYLTDKEIGTEYYAMWEDDHFIIYVGDDDDPEEVSLSQLLISGKD